MAVVMAEALRGQGGSTPWDQQQQQEPESSSPSSPSASSSSSSSAAAAAAAAAEGSGVRQQQQKQQQQEQQQQNTAQPYDALVVGGGRRFARELLKGIDIAATTYSVARLPPRILYLPPGLSDARTPSSAVEAWGKLADHVMCATAQEAAVVKGAPASAVGHPLSAFTLAAPTPKQKQHKQQQVGDKRRGNSSSSSSSSSSSGAGSSSSESSCSSSSGSRASVSSAESAAAAAGDRLSWLRQRARQAARITAAGSGAGSSAFVMGDRTRFWERVAAQEAAFEGSKGDGAKGGEGAKGADDRRPLVAVLPGCFEAHIASNVGVFGECCAALSS